MYSEKKRNFKMPYLPYFSLNFHNFCTTFCKGKFSSHLLFNSHRLISSGLPSSAKRMPELIRSHQCAMDSCSLMGGEKSYDMICDWLIF